ncbi:MAG: GntR family transcriptional regulator [Alphaproteobacteria bacterium]|nr:GntR family transcriptional regulator [Alphaproteobacteria bacterium]
MSIPSETPSDLPAPSIGDRIVQAIRRDIFDGVLASGSRIKIRDLAVRYAVSEMPVREALRQLEGEGLLDAQPHRGATVVAIDETFIRNVYEMREALSGMVAAAAATRATASEREALRAAMVAHERAAETGDDDAILTADRNFHAILDRMAANPVADRAMAMGRGLTESLRARCGFGGDRRAQTVAEHRALVAAIVAGDARGAELFARVHVAAARADLLRQFKATAG